MFAWSFRFASALLRPLGFRPGRALLLTLAVIVAGCGGSAKVNVQLVAGPGFRFSAPAGWKVGRSGGEVSARHDAHLLQVWVFPLLKPYRPALFAAVERELDQRMSVVAKAEHARIEGTGVAAPAGIKSHVWRLAAQGHVDEYTFVLDGRREYQLLCRRPSSGDGSVCRQFDASFALR